MLPTQPGRHSLLCVLDWGLGHASRSLALAAQLEAAGESVHFASSGRAQKFLERERPDLPVHELPAYKVTYPTRSMPFNVAIQLPRWLRTIRRERRYTEKLVKKQGFDRVISDNRFGCYAANVPSIFLTHQLHPITNNRLVTWLYQRYLQRFDGFWVPDYPEEERRISGRLSAVTGYQDVLFIGPLSRLVTTPSHGLQPMNTCVLALLSGPEPMRSRLETIVIRELKSVPGQHVLVRGLPGGTTSLPDPPPNVTIHDFADAHLLAQLLPAARHIVCRSGYSTLMDVYAVTSGDKLILVPTPGQTEQVYLAERETKRVGCQWVPDQEDLLLKNLLHF
jgi:UDP:flavonoid glycosyltransferase YjiC (YdhE family)